MTLQPDEQDTIFDRIKNAITSNSLITNFSPNSPERAITHDAFAAEMVERQHELLAVQLSSRIDYAGKTITENDLENLGVNTSFVDLELLNSYIEESDLDELVKRNGVTRDPGSFATGEVTFTTTNESVTIPEGIEVGTDPDATGNFLQFVTDESASPDAGGTSVTVGVTAAERGSEYNIGSGSIEYMPSPPPGVSSVTNTSATTSGEDEETTEELRQRAKDVLIRQTGGGTTDGIEGGLVSQVDGLDLADVIVDEFEDADPQYFDVVVDGGPSDSELQSLIDDLQPTAINGNLVRPTSVLFDISATVSGSDIQTNNVESDLNSYVQDLGIGEDLIVDQIIAIIINADEGILGIDDLVITVVDDAHTYSSGTSIYEMSKSPFTNDSMKNVEDATGTTYTKGTDYDDIDNSGDGSDDSIDWSIGGSAPGDGEEFYVDYEVDRDITIGNREKAEPNSVNITVS